jgi:diacylglycerol O-acyltransferase / wax synthase
MADRLSPLDVSFLYMEDPTTPMHVGGVAIFQVPEEGFDHDRLITLIKERIAFVPRYRQRIRTVPGRLANPVWVDDERFDVTYHVRRSALPRPGNDEQLHELVGRLMSRPLDKSRPLWEMYLVEGLDNDRFAVVTKSHHAMVDGINAIDIAQVILDATPEPRRNPPDTWRPAPEPSWFELVAGAASDVVRRPANAVDTVRSSVGDLQQAAERVIDVAAGLLATARVAVRTAPSSPLNTTIGEQRRYATARVELDDLKRVRKSYGCTVNDVVLATVTGALRSWLLSRGRGVTAQTTMRALVPVSVRPPAASAAEDGARPDGAAAVGNQIAAYLVDLPVGEPNPAIRLEQVSYAMRAVKDNYQAVGAEALIGVAGFAPPTLHSLGARVASSWSRRIFNVVVTNVPGPQFPLYAAGAQLLAAYPVVPLAKGQAVSIGLTSYNGGAFFGLNADRDAMADVDVLAQCLVDSLRELVETSEGPRRVTDERAAGGEPSNKQ